MRTTLRAPDGYRARQSVAYSRVYLVKQKVARPGYDRRIGMVEKIKPRGKPLWEATAEDGRKWLAQTGTSAVAWLCERDNGTRRETT